MRVGLAVDSPTVRLSATSRWELRAAEGSRWRRRLGAGDTVTIRSGGDGRLTVQVGSGRAEQTRVALLTAEPRDRGGFVSVGQVPYRGRLVIRATAPGRLTTINTVAMEEYLLGVVPREIGRVGEDLLEAAKAQAVAARTYAIRYLGRREALGFDVFATVDDQVYGGTVAEHEPVSRAVRETEGEVLTYDGELVEAFYHSTCAGRTAAIEEVWDAPPRPYLVSVVDIDPRTGEAFDRSSSRFEWTVRWTREELEQILDRTLADSLPAGRNSIGRLRDMRVLERTPSGRVRTMRISTDARDFTVGRDRVRWILRTPENRLLNSSKFDVQVVRGADGAVREVVASGGGWGHGIGMCQVGAMGRARAGQDYRTILRAYYTGTRVTDLY